MNKSGNAVKIIILMIIIVDLVAGAAACTAKVVRKSAERAAAREAKKQAELEAQAEEEAKAAKENDPYADILDKYSMQEFCHDNAMAVFDVLSSGDLQGFEALMIDPSGCESVMDFADWSGADFGNAVSMGSGSLTTEPNEAGQMDESERFFVYANGTRYVFFIETRTSDNGRTNDGVSAVGVTTFDHFDATDYAWNGEQDGQSALAGELFWNK